MNNNPIGIKTPDGVATHGVLFISDAHTGIVGRALTDIPAGGKISMDIMEVKALVDGLRATIRAPTHGKVKPGQFVAWARPPTRRAQDKRRPFWTLRGTRRIEATK